MIINGDSLDACDAGTLSNDCVRKQYSSDLCHPCERRCSLSISDLSSNAFLPCRVLALPYCLFEHLFSALRLLGASDLRKTYCGTGGQSGSRRVCLSDCRTQNSSDGRTPFCRQFVSRRSQHRCLTPSITSTILFYLPSLKIFFQYPLSQLYRSNP